MALTFEIIICNERGQYFALK